MAAPLDIDGDIAIFRAMIDGPDAGLAPFLADHPDLGSVQEARDDLAELIVRLEEVRAGHVASHAEVATDVEARRRSHRVAAE